MLGKRKQQLISEILGNASLDELVEISTQLSAYTNDWKRAMQTFKEHGVQLGHIDAIFGGGDEMRQKCKDCYKTLGDLRNPPQCTEMRANCKDFEPIVERWGTTHAAAQ